MKPETKQRLITAAVVFGGIVALGVADRLGVSGDVLAGAGSVLILLAGSLKSMLVAEPQP